MSRPREALDDEMAARIAAHRARRGPAWRTSRSRSTWSARCNANAPHGRAVLVDCLTLWLTNLMVARAPGRGRSATACSRRCPRCRGALVLVSNEVGQGIVPDNAMARAFVDHAGRLHQRIAEQADAVVFMTAGLPQRLK